MCNKISFTQIGYVLGFCLNGKQQLLFGELNSSKYTHTKYKEDNFIFADAPEVIYRIFSFWRQITVTYDGIM